MWLCEDKHNFEIEAETEKEESGAGGGGRDNGPRLPCFHYNQKNISDISQMNLNINRKDRCFNVISNTTGKLIIKLGKDFNILAMPTSNS